MRFNLPSFRRPVTAVAVAAVALTAATGVAEASPAQVGKCSVQAPYNAVGVIFHPNGDKFEYWVNQGGSNYNLMWAYKGHGANFIDLPNSKKHGSISKNMTEHRTIRFYLHNQFDGDTPVASCSTS
jgi:hypothetical protein